MLGLLEESRLVLNIKAFSEYLLKQRKALGLNQQQVAYRAQVDQSVVSRVERGEQLGEIESLIGIAEALGVDFSYCTKLLMGKVDLPEYPERYVPIPVDFTEAEHAEVVQKVDDIKARKEVKELRKESTAQKESTQRILNRPPKPKGK